MLYILIETNSEEALDSPSVLDNLWDIYTYISTELSVIAPTPGYAYRPSHVIENIIKRVDRSSTLENKIKEILSLAKLTFGIQNNTRSYPGNTLDRIHRRGSNLVELSANAIEEISQTQIGIERISRATVIFVNMIEYLNLEDQPDIEFINRVRQSSILISRFTNDVGMRVLMGLLKIGNTRSSLVTRIKELDSILRLLNSLETQNVDSASLMLPSIVEGRFKDTRSIGMLSAISYIKSDIRTGETVEQEPGQYIFVENDNGSRHVVDKDEQVISATYEPEFLVQEALAQIQVYSDQSLSAGEYNAVLQVVSHFSTNSVDISLLSDILNLYKQISSEIDFESNIGEYLYYWADTVVKRDEIDIEAAKKLLKVYVLTAQRRMQPSRLLDRNYLLLEILLRSDKTVETLADQIDTIFYHFPEQVAALRDSSDKTNPDEKIIDTIVNRAINFDITQTKEFIDIVIRLESISTTLRNPYVAITQLLGNLPEISINDVNVLVRLLKGLSHEEYWSQLIFLTENWKVIPQYISGRVTQVTTFEELYELGFFSDLPIHSGVELGISIFVLSQNSASARFWNPNTYKQVIQGLSNLYRQASGFTLDRFLSNFEVFYGSDVFESIFEQEVLWQFLTDECSVGEYIDITSRIATLSRSEYLIQQNINIYLELNELISNRGRLSELNDKLLQWELASFNSTIRSEYTLQEFEQIRRHFRLPTLLSLAQRYSTQENGEERLTRLNSIVASRINDRYREFRYQDIRTLLGQKLEIWQEDFEIYIGDVPLSQNAESYCRDIRLLALYLANDGHFLTNPKLSDETRVWFSGVIETATEDTSKISANRLIESLNEVQRQIGIQIGNLKKSIPVDKELLSKYGLNDINQTNLSEFQVTLVNLVRIIKLISLSPAELASNQIDNGSKVTKTIESLIPYLQRNDPTYAEQFNNQLKRIRQQNLGVARGIRLICTDEPDVLLNIGNEPVRTCQSTNSDGTDHLERVDTLVASGHRKVWIAVDEDNQIIARAVQCLGTHNPIRDNEGTLALVLDRVYSKFGDIFDLYFLLAQEELAKAMNAKPFKVSQSGTMPITIHLHEGVESYVDAGTDGGIQTGSFETHAIVARV